LFSPCKSCFALKKELADACSRIEMLEKSFASSSRVAMVDSLQGFVSNATLMNCNTENLVAREGCIATIPKNGSSTCL
jgi:hypothetical protein